VYHFLRKMSFISYAQNLEDVMLYRALKHVEHGFYIDVGAQHPVIDSVTKAFYDRGWRGINIEPVSEYFQLLQQDRPEDINLNVCVGANEGKVVLHEVLHEGLSTVSKDYAARHAEAGYEVRSRTVPCTTLDAICAEQGVDTVHFLKVDVEGAEREVLEGFAFDKVRPWIVVVEANEPSSTRDVSEEWEPRLLSKSYKCVCYDGLNRFYVATEHLELQEYFNAPPNVFDGYIIYAHWLAEQKLAHQESVALQQVYASFSWRITAPLRKGKDMLDALVALPVRALQHPIKTVLQAMLRSQRLRRLGVRFFAGHPAIRTRVLRLAGITLPYTAAPPASAARGAATELPESARVIYAQLRELHHTRGGK
jgi:FkbM family methyltransferase